MNVLSVEWLNGNGPQDIISMITAMIDQFVEGGTEVVLHIIYGLIKISRVVYILLIVLGIFLYFGHINRRMGKNFIIGGIVMALMFEYLIPYLLGSL